MIKNFLVSVVIPTHNRSKYAIYCVQSLLDIESPEIEIVVHDTSNDACELRNWMSRQSDSRINYTYHSGPLSMTGNHEKAVEKANGEYVCLIGDDDTVSKYILTIAKYCYENNIGAMTPILASVYSWPDFKTKNLGGAHSKSIYLSKYTCEINRIDTSDAIKKSLDIACQGTDCLPKLYHGLVRKSSIDGIKSKHGKLFHGASPDISASLSIAFEEKEYYTIDFPFSVPGLSGGSNTGRSAMKTHKGDVKDEPHLKAHADLVWQGYVPYFFSVETLWAQAACDTFVDTGNLNLLSKFNFSRLYASCYLSHFDFKSAIYKSFRELNKGGFGKVKWIDIIKEWFFLIVSYSWAKFKRLCRPTVSSGREVLGSVDNVRLARNVIDENLSLDLNRLIPPSQINS